MQQSKQPWYIGFQVGTAKSSAAHMRMHCSGHQSSCSAMQPEHTTSCWLTLWSNGATSMQTNERTLEWEESAQIQLLKMYVAEKSGKVRHGAFRLHCSVQR